VPSAPERPYEDRDWLAAHLREERREADLLGEIREALFGMQDGLVSTLAVVSTVGGATNDRFPILVAGLASALAGVFSMSAGEYLSSKSQREIFLAQIEKEREEVHGRPGESEAEVAYMLEQEGLDAGAAKRVAAELAREPNVLLKTMVEKELGIDLVEGRNALQGALVMGAAFGLASIPPILPYILLPVGAAVWASIALTAVVLFTIGAVKARWTLRNPVRSGLEVVALAAFAGIAGYFFGSILPALIGVSAPAV
jgi:VIT1/CCC1 family predicted Fe2+/Mn2+ transporter